MPHAAVSVVMPVYNGERTLRAAADSILTQSFADFEFLIVDDASTDDTAAILDGYARRDARVRLLRQERRGPCLSAALRIGCAAAAGRFIARMDADDVAFADRLERQVRFLDEHPEIAVVGGALQYLGAGGPLPRFLRHPTSPEAVRDALQEYNCIAHPTAVIRRDVYEAVGGFRRVFMHAEEYDLWLRIAERHPLANLSDPVLYYRLHPGQISFAQIGEQVIYTLGARAAARRRRSGGADPFEGREAITRADLLTLGLTESGIDAAIIDRYVTWGSFLAGLGALEDAQLLAAEMRRLPLAGAARRRLAAEADWLSGKVSVRQGSLARGAARLLRAVAARPGLAFALMRRLAGRPRSAA